jgi:uncharacterized membrane protein
MKLNEIIKQFFQDKEGSYSLRELVTLLFVLVVVVGWISHQFFHFAMPDNMFYSFVSMIGAGNVGYSLEKKSKPADPPKP